MRTDGGVCATGPQGHSFRVTDPWSPDGQRIAYLSASSQGTAVAVADADGGNRRVLTEFGSYGELAWSPDGQWIATDESTQLLLIKPDGTETLVADTDRRPAVDPAWMPAGELPSNRRPCVGFGATDHYRDLLSGGRGVDSAYFSGSDRLKSVELDASTDAKP